MTIYDMNRLRQQNVPPESLAYWVQANTETNLKKYYWSLRSFIDAYGLDVFWAYKDQQMQQKYGKTLTDAEKAGYIHNMMNDEKNYL